MSLLLAALAAAAPAPAPTPANAVAAERAFAADAQRIGQWTAFGRWAAPGAVMFLPQPVDARAFFGGRPDPKQAVRWWPNFSWTSCDGRSAVNHGGARWPGGAATNFTTVWHRQRAGWRWSIDLGETVATPLDESAPPVVRRPVCRNLPRALAPTLVKAPLTPGALPDRMHGHSADRSLAWGWAWDAATKRLAFAAWQWDGNAYALVHRATPAPE